MTLRTQLLLVACSVLVLPWAGWQFVRQMEGLLREGREQALLASAEAIARGMAVRPEALPAGPPTLFVQPLSDWPRLDGDAGDWRGPVMPMRRFGDGMELSLGRVEDSLVLHARARDATPQRADAHWPMAADRDHFLLELSGPHGQHRLRLANAASGPLVVTADDGGPPPISPQGEWRDLDDGYAIELRLPQGYRVDALGLSHVDVAPDGRARRVGTGSDIPARPWPLLQREARHERALAPLVPPGMRARLVDAEGWVLAEGGALSSTPRPQDDDAGELFAADDPGLPWWRRQLYRWLIMAGDAVVQPGAGSVRSEAEEVWQALSGVAGATWRRDPEGQRQLLSAAVPVLAGGQVRGALLLEREDDAALLLTDRALGGLLLVTLLALLASGGLVFVFASRLSARIRRLRDAAENALDREGRLTPFPRVAAHDEIGDLSRSFGRLLDEVAANTEYLRSLAGKLSHELNTPLAIVRTSLENLEPGDVAKDAQPYLDRARSGVERLGALVRAMSEASRIEQAIASAEAERFDLRALLADCAEGYRDLLGARRLEVHLPDGTHAFHGAPDLVVQALDKLIDNASGFCPPEGWVRIALETGESGVRIRVANQGPRLPEAMRHRLFDSLVSLRDHPRGAVHLGLGLYVVRLVCEVHRGHAEADDLPGGEGVVFTLHLRGMGR